MPIPPAAPLPPELSQPRPADLAKLVTPEDNRDITMADLQRDCSRRLKSANCRLRLRKLG